eukprot:15483410-Alexandrium_andersonii.AAC.1
MRGRRPDSVAMEWPAAAALRLHLRAAESGVATRLPSVAGRGAQPEADASLTLWAAGGMAED